MLLVHESYCKLKTYNAISDRSVKLQDERNVTDRMFEHEFDLL